jgi:hypothetical protein
MKTCWTILRALLLASLLTRSAFADSCSVVDDTPNMRVHDCAGVHVVHLKGTPVERAHAMGVLVKSGKLSNEVLKYFVFKVTDLLAEDVGPLALPITLAYHQLTRLLHRAAPPFLEEEVDALSQGLGQDPIVIRRGLSLPDAGVLIQGLGSYPGMHFLPATGCTSGAAPLEGGGYAYGRNLDFAGVGAWDRHPMIAVMEPPSGSEELRHLVIGGDGLPFGGITGVNEAGITFAVHQNYSRDISLSGVPMIFIGELVLRRAHNLDEALQVLRTYRPAEQWTFVVTDLRKGVALAVESSSRIFLPRMTRAGEPFAQSNHNLHEESRANENSTYGLLMNSQFRFAHVLNALRAPIQDVGTIAKALAYQENPLGELSAYHDVLKAETIQTVLVEARPGSDIAVAVSTDPAPASSGRFARFDLGALFKEAPPSFTSLDYAQTPPEVRHRQLTFTAAYSRYFDERQFAEGASLLFSQRTLDAALFRCVAMAEAGRYDDAVRLADEALRDPRFVSEPAYIRDSVTQVKLVSLIRNRRDEDARTLAGNVVERGTKQPALLEIARRLLNRESIPGWRLALHFDFFSGDLGGRKD